MLVAIFQTFAALIACGLLYFLWAMTAPMAGRARQLVLAGLLIRAFAGQALFWISYLRLPVASNLQTGDGLWFFAIDATNYMRLASQTASGGLMPIIGMSRTEGSVVFVQALALFIAAFGNVASVALLLNLFCYMGICAIVTRWGSIGGHVSSSATLALAAMALSPSAILWALQPLKDTLFIFLEVGFIGACVAWQRKWTAIPVGRELAMGVFLAGMAMAITLYGIAGIRWYVAAAMLAASGGFLLLVAATASGRRVYAFVVAIFIFALISRAFVLSAEQYIPPAIQRVLNPRTAVVEIRSLGGILLTTAEQTREGFERTGGATSIAAGRAIQSAEKKEIPVVSSVESNRSRMAGDKKAAKVAVVAAPKPAPLAIQKSGEAGPPQPPTPALISAPAFVPPVPVSTPESVALRMPASRLGRLATGLAAFILPRTIAQALGIIEVGGGRGLWAFAEFDTLVFDAVLLVAVIFFIRSVRGASFRNPIFWLILLMVLLLGMPMLYTVTNFGTLFRHRLMIYVALALIPIALSTPVIDRARRNNAEPSVPDI